MILCAQKGSNGDAYNLASGVETRIIDIANSILEITNSKSKIKLMPKRIWDNSGNRFGSTEKSNVELGFKSEVNLISGLRNTISWTKKNRIFISSLINKHKIHF